MLEETTTTETTEAATVSGAVGDTGTQEQTVDSGETTPTVTEPSADGTEGETTTEEQGAASPASLPANERIQQLIAKDKDREAKINELQGKLTQLEQQQTQRPDFVELDYDRINAHFNTTLEKIDELRLEGRALEAMELQDGLNALRGQIRDNERRKQEYVTRAQQAQQGQQVAAQLNQRIAEAADLVRQDANITPEVWKEGEAFFAAERQANKLLDAQYREQVMMHGPIAGMLFAKDYVMKHMGQKQAEATRQKEAAKSVVPGGKTATTTAPVKDFKTMSDEEFNLELNRIKFGT